jgi:hypothetical protein
VVFGTNRKYAGQLFAHSSRPGYFQPGGQIVAQTSDASQHGLWVVNTCGGLASSPTWTVGQFFQHGWYLEFVGEWNATGFAGMPGVAASVQTGFYGYDGYWYPTPGTYYETDNPDMFASVKWWQFMLAAPCFKTTIAA